MVYFSYVPDKKLIEDFNLHVKSGQRVAIVGPTGCGKTTIINLLMRFYDVNSGTIKVSGHDIRKITRESLRDNYGMVLQETWLKKGTIRDNIIMGKLMPQMRKSLQQQRHPMPTALSDVCRRAMTLKSVRTVAACHRDRSSYYASQESCSAYRLC